MQMSFVIGDRGLGNSGDAHPHWMMAGALADGYLVVGASAVGQIHLRRGLPRDDAFAVRLSGPWLAVAVADGVGSRPLSRYGASYVAEALSSLLLRSLLPPLSAFTQSNCNGAPTDLVPPQSIEEVKFQPTVLRSGSGRNGLTARLVQWIKQTESANQSTLEELPVYDLQQVASVGWWYCPPSPTKREIPSDEQQDIVHELDVNGVTQDSAPEPNLITVIEESFKKAHLGLRGHAKGLGVDLADLSCTALALLLNIETGRGVVGQVGDGAILGLTSLGAVKELVEAIDTADPQSVYTLNKPNFQDYLSIQYLQSLHVDPFEAYFVMTDGLASDLLYTPEEYALKEWSSKVVRNLRLSSSPTQAAAGMLNWLASYQVRGSWDDRTLVVVTQQEIQDENGKPFAENS